ncbi:hypothetical protein LMG22037_05819 [Paraburkholderia phenoliruptrix]|uniref:Uncharacterized protein n=1 Tax=Paraburkholderia phenoliruptrix TaxID=252970 RepID=A0A6J5CD34_9BURK|nr:hypothetical protein [Paraburkholderia phenoliruptrix]CAB3733708.1 hypothetical protein LMG22037_05819 [Paraburkholderia phenoliruptrix]
MSYLPSSRLNLGKLTKPFILMMNMERACRVQVAIQSTGEKTYPVPREVCELTARQYETWADAEKKAGGDPFGREWSAYLQRLEATTSSYRD